MVPSGQGDFDFVDERQFERTAPLERPKYPCRNGTPKRTRFKKGAKQVRQNGKHRRRTRKINW